MLGQIPAAGTLGASCNNFDMLCDGGLVCVRRSEDSGGTCQPRGYCCAGNLRTCELALVTNRCEGGSSLDPVIYPDATCGGRSDGATRACNATGACGNGLRDPGEECDDGNGADDDACSNGCMGARCGDGILQKVKTDRFLPGLPRPVLAQEFCDDGNTRDGDGCLSASGESLSR
ncbi:MAG: hypothetical protein IT428_18755 [Planctomycetaceae bacterium]|nr:hypothetical protein [Planctomycetaceae bacterium]